MTSRSPTILAFAGSTRGDSLNKKLVQVASAGAREAGGEVTVVDLRDYPMPVFDQDDEDAHGKPDAARRFKQLLVTNEGFLIAAPEYNSSVTGVLKNAIDWASRADDDDPSPVPAYRGKVVSLMAASPGALGGLRGLVHVRAILGNLGCIVLPGQVTLGRASRAFGDEGTITDEKQRERVLDLGRNLVETLRKLNG